MTGAEIALIITAVGTLITAAGGVAIALVTRNNAVITKKNSEALGEVHTMVNQQRTDSIRYQTALIKALKAAGVDVPDDQSLSATTEERNV
jgi:high-affinity K+ transport system ATPase subunit B